MSTSTKTRKGTSCDTCKRRKVRCVSTNNGDGSCNTCTMAKLSCTYTGTFKNRVISKDYIERLESRLSEVELLLKQAQSSASPVPSSSARYSAVEMLDNVGEHEASGFLETLPPDADVNGKEELELQLSDNDETFDGVTMLQQGISSLSMSPRFHGRSSNSKLVSDIFEHRRQTTEYSASPSKQLPPPTLLYKRPEFWSSFPWESEPEIFLNLFTFPEKDLFDSLVALYFEHINYLYALLHRPTFETLITQGIHYRDPQFANVAMLVIAIGSRFSSDPRVVLEKSGSWLSSGWKWFSQVNLYNKATLTVPNLYNLQAIVLYTIYIQDCPSQEEGWSLISAGLRLAQAIGAHRKKVYSSKLTAVDELWKRAFWCLCILDRQFCLTLGRPCSLHDEDFDLDYPIDCDDEFWLLSDPEESFKQPPGKPSKIAFITSFIEVSFILSYALRTIYSINKSKAFLGYTGQGWEERLVTQLDSKINSWEAKIPAHLRFSETIEDPLFFVQAAMLSSAYHDLRVLVHHPFVAPGGKPTSITYSCLASCDNAARANSGIALIISCRAPTVLVPSLLLHTAFTSAIILFFKLFSARRAGKVIDVAGVMAGVHGCMRVLENAESRSWTAGQRRDILHNLAVLGDFPLQLTSSTDTGPPTSNQSSIEIPSMLQPWLESLSSMDFQQLLNNNHHTPLVPQSMFDTDEQIRNMWNDAPMGVGSDLDWDSYLATLNWMSPNHSHQL
ncbi:fungal-specific transcription factor domain-containing protein [Lentinula lateritia]|uniref:Fungal-specific transcription factor domain-containing protein n=1 Tax=Lentinula lateritia TaxID=40482 RepID=A0ABQ8VKT8_9AGAR|nr:fungal-specific transcription factor domain-containing protein [Lentinula lateritia]